MQMKPSTVESRARAAPPAYKPPADRTAGGRSTLHDVERAEGEGMTLPPESLSASEERHQARNEELRGRSMAFDLAEESSKLPASRDAAQSGRTLAKLGTLRLTLMRIDAGRTIAEHRSVHQVSIQTVSGHVVLHIDGLPMDLPAGNVVVLEREVAHDIVAKEDSTLLVTVSAGAA